MSLVELAHPNALGPLTFPSSSDWWVTQKEYMCLCLPTSPTRWVVGELGLPFGMCPALKPIGGAPRIGHQSIFRVSHTPLLVTETTPQTLAPLWGHVKGQKRGQVVPVGDGWRGKGGIPVTSEGFSMAFASLSPQIPRGPHVCLGLPGLCPPWHR